MALGLVMHDTVQLFPKLLTLLLAEYEISYCACGHVCTIDLLHMEPINQSAVMKTICNLMFRNTMDSI